MTVPVRPADRNHGDVRCGDGEECGGRGRHAAVMSDFDDVGGRNDEICFASRFRIPHQQPPIAADRAIQYDRSVIFRRIASCQNHKGQRPADDFVASCEQAFVRLTGGAEIGCSADLGNGQRPVEIGDFPDVIIVAMGQHDPIKRADVFSLKISENLIIVVSGSGVDQHPAVSV